MSKNKIIEQNQQDKEPKKPKILQYEDIENADFLNKLSFNEYGINPFNSDKSFSNFNDANSRN